MADSLVIVRPVFLRAHLIPCARVRKTSGGRRSWQAIRLAPTKCPIAPSHCWTGSSRDRYYVDRFRANNRDKNPGLPGGRDCSPTSLIFSNCVKKSEMSLSNCVRGNRNSCSRASAISSTDLPSLSIPQIFAPIGLRLKQSPCSMSSNTAPS